MLKAKVTLRIASRSRSLSAIQALLGAPTDEYSSEERDGGSGRVTKKTVWELQVQGAPFELLILEMAAILDSHSHKIVDLSRDCEIELFCYLYSENGQGGATLSRDVLKRLALHNVDIHLDIYAPVG
jgi:hypothetical protein